MINRNKLRGLMAEKNIKQGEMAESIGISKNAFSMKLNEKSRFDENEVYMLSKLLNVDVNFLFTYQVG